MTSRSVVSPRGQRVTFVELFFDLVFVFSVTQVVGLLHDGLGWGAAARGVLAFWFVWWAWTQFTWALNAADTTHELVVLRTLLATGVAFFMAVGVPGAFGERALWFAVPYVVVRGIGLTLYGWVAERADSSQHAAVRVFALASLGGLAAMLLGAALGGAAQYWIWGLAIALDVVAAEVGGRREGWGLHAEHFGERHSLFVIIALGESLIVAGGGLTGASWNASLVSVALAAVALSCGLWWTYFTRARARLEHALRASRGAARSTMARDAFSLLHFPVIGGVIAYGAVVEEVVLHPSSPLLLPWRVTLGIGLVLFVGGAALALWRATGRVPLPRTALVVLTALVVVALDDLPPVFTLLVALAGVAAIALVERRRGIEAAPPAAAPAPPRPVQGAGRTG